MSIAVFTPDVVGRQMAGPGIRAFHLAREIATRFPTTLVAKLEDFDAAELGGGSPVPALFSAVDRRQSDARRILRSAEVIISQPHAEIFETVSPRQTILWDLFDPVILEMLEMSASGLRHRVHFEREWRRLRRALSSGNACIHATPAQRHFYSGVLAGRRWRRGHDAELRWIEVPFGVEEIAPEPAAPETLMDPPAFIWGGGLWDWLDPATAIEATRLVNDSGRNCRLRFLGLSRPDDVTAVASRRRVRHLLDTSADLILQNRQWTPYRERSRWLRGSRAALMLHKATLESQYSIRTRFFDALWCSLPIVATEGGYTSDLVRDEGLGVTVRAGDTKAVAAAMTRLLLDDNFHASCVKNIERLRPRFLWPRVVEPLIAEITRLQQL